MVTTQVPMQQLELVKEAKIFDIVEGSLDPRLEASGVLAKDGLFYVIFDNLPHIACIGPELARAARDNHLIMQEKGHRRGFEDITYDPWSGRFYVLIESLRRGRSVERRRRFSIRSNTRTREFCACSRKRENWARERTSSASSSGARFATRTWWA